MARYKIDEGNERFGIVLTGLINSAFIFGVVYSCVKGFFVNALVFLVLPLLLAYKTHFYLKNERLEWIELDEQGLSYNVGGKTYHVQPGERLRLKNADPGESSWGVDMVLHTPHGKVQIDERLDRVGYFVKELKTTWSNLDA